MQTHQNNFTKLNKPDNLPNQRQSVQILRNKQINIAASKLQTSVVKHLLDVEQLPTFFYILVIPQFKNHNIRF